jgi:hypothetical protein
MKTTIALAALALLALFTPLQAGEISGQYVEARTCDVWTGACFANSEMNLTGKHALLGWKIEKGQGLDGLSVVAVVEATDTLGLEQRGPSKAVLLVDKKASTTQRAALIALAKKLGGKLTENVVAVETAPISLAVTSCKGGGCAKLDAGVAKLETRCFHEGTDSVCGHEDNYYPPLTKGVKAHSAMVLEHQFTGKAFDKTWSDPHRRGAYVGSFNMTE